MLSCNEIADAAEAVVRAYLARLFSVNDLACTDIASHAGDCYGAAYWTAKDAVLKTFDTKKETLEKRTYALRRVAQILYVLSCVVDMAQKALTCTERDLYYRNPLLFPGGQRDTHYSIQRLCRLMDFLHPLTTPAVPCGPGDICVAFCRQYTREGLHIGASGKSLLVGNIIFSVPMFGTTSSAQHNVDDELLGQRWAAKGGAGDLKDALEIDAMHHVSGVLVNMAMGLRGCRFRGATGDNRPPYAVIIIEKESTLRALLEGGVFSDVGAPLGRCVFLCSKGYPCRASRLLLRGLHREMPGVPIYALVDGDPHGMRIVLTFMGLFGEEFSLRPCVRQQRDGKEDVKQRRHSVRAANRLSALLPISWLGVRPSSLPHVATGRAPLTLFDQKVLTQLIQRVADAIHFFANNMADAVHTADDVGVICRSLNDMLQEAEWMERNSLKCAIQAWPAGPLQLLHSLL